MTPHANIQSFTLEQFLAWINSSPTMVIAERLDAPRTTVYRWRERLRHPSRQTLKLAAMLAAAEARELDPGLPITRKRIARK